MRVLVRHFNAENTMTWRWGLYLLGGGVVEMALVRFLHTEASKLALSVVIGVGVVYLYRAVEK
jgi:hypothetical protein